VPAPPGAAGAIGRSVPHFLGRLKERYPRVARYYALGYEAATRSVTWAENTERKALAQRLDGGYLLKTDRQDLTDEEIWRTYLLLTRVEAAFRAMKSPLCERPPRTRGPRSAKRAHPVERPELNRQPDEPWELSRSLERWGRMLWPRSGTYATCRARAGEG